MQFQKTEPSQNLNLFRRFSAKNGMQSAIQIKSDKNNFTCIQCADEERFITLLKQSLIRQRSLNIAAML